MPKSKVSMYVKSPKKIVFINFNKCLQFILFHQIHFNILLTVPGCAYFWWRSMTVKVEYVARWSPSTEPVPTPMARIDQSETYPKA